MNARIIARSLGKAAPHSLSERIARFAIAVNACSARGASKSYWEQARREFTSEPDIDPKEAVPESAPDSECWHPAPGSTGHSVSVARRGFQV